MKIVIEIFEAGGAGAVRHNTLQQAAYLAAQGDSVTLVSNTFPAPLCGVRYLHASAYHRSFRMGTLLPELAFSLNAARRIEILHRAEGVDCCVGQGHSCSLGLARVKRQHGVPFVIVVRGDIFSRPLGTYDLPSTAFYMLCAPFAYRHADHVVVVGSHMAARVRRFSRSPSRVSFIPNGIDTEGFSRDSGRMAFRRQARNEILYVGSLARHKGCSTLVRALALLKDIDCRCTFVGSGPEEDALAGLAARSGVASRCEFRGWIERDRLGSFYRGADVFVCPSLDEPQGVVNLEALSQGCPVVASRVGGIPDMVKHGVNGLLVPPNDPKRLARALRHICTDRDLRLRLAGAAKASVVPFRWDKVVADFRQVLLRTVNECRRSRKSR